MLHDFELLLNQLGDGKLISNCQSFSVDLLNHLGDGKLILDDNNALGFLLNHLGDGKPQRLL